VTNRTQLASGEIVNGAILSIWLAQPADEPESVVVMWPQRSTAVSTRHYPDVAAIVCRLVANASTELAAIKAGGDDHQHALSTNRGGYFRKYPSGSPKCSARSSLSTWGTRERAWSPRQGSRFRRRAL
jgi:hypothetical protein